MIKRVRRKFIISAMVAMTFCITLLLVLGNLLNCWQVNKRLNCVITELAEETDKFELKGRPEHGERWPESEEPGLEHADEKREKKGHHAWMEQYEKLFFGVRLFEDGTWETFSRNPDTLSQEQVLALAKQAYASQKESGHIKHYKYLVQKTEDNTNIYLLECMDEMISCRYVAVASALAGIVGIGLVFLVVYVMSGKAIEPLKESIEKQKRFITDAGHELKTPVAVIGTNMDVLKIDLGAENEWVDSTQRQVTKLRNLIADMISLSKMDEAQKELSGVVFSLSSTVSDCLEIYKMMAEAEGKKINIAVEPDIRIKADEATIRQMLTILLENAVKYATDGSEISILLQKRGKKAVFLTKNEWNHDVKTEDLEKLFERFYRGDKSRNRDGKNCGYGLGLSIAQMAAQNNKGKLTVYEDEKKRLVFRAEFKLFTQI